MPSRPIKFASGKSMPNRFILAPMTNSQSHEDGILSDDEYHWLTMRAKGGFGMTMTCAAHVQADGKGFPGQLGVFDDKHLPGLKRLASGIQEHGSLAIVQLHHAGMRSPENLISGQPHAPSAQAKYNARGLSLEEVFTLRDDFIAAAKRSEKAGFDGVEIHGAHGYILAQFLSPEINQRTDQYGGTLENRSRLIVEIIDGIRATCSSDFILGLRLSPERFGMRLSEIKAFCQQCINSGKLDFLDISLWDSFKDPHEEEHQGQSLLSHFTSLDWKNTKLTVAGKIGTAEEVRKILESGVDFVGIGRAGILHHDFPKRVIQNPDFVSTPNPVTRDYLRKEGLGEKFVEYMGRWEGFVAD